MAFYEASGLGTTPTATADKAYVQLWNGGSTSRLRLREIGITNTSSTAGKVALKRTTARGTNSTTQAGTPIDSNDPAAGGTLDLTWSVDATVTGNYIRRAHVAAVVGAGYVWGWWNGPGLAIATSAGLVVCVPTAVAGFSAEVWAVWEEN